MSSPREGRCGRDFRRSLVFGFVACLCLNADLSGQSVTEFPFVNPTYGSPFPHSLAAAPDGSIWFDAVNAIGRLSSNGSVTWFPVSNVYAVAFGSDGNLWFTDDSNHRIGRLTPGGAVTEFAVPQNGMPTEIAAGPDGAVWFVASGNLGRVTASGSIQEFNVGATHVTAGPDGAVWFAGANVGRITSAGAVTTFPTGTVSAITAGADGAIWYSSGAGISRITTSGVINLFGHGQARHMAAGSDGAVWFPKWPKVIARLTTSGEYSEYPISVGWLLPFYGDDETLVSGADGALWFGESLSYGQNVSICRMDITVLAAGGCPPDPDPANEGLPTYALDFEQTPAGTPLDAIGNPQIRFSGSGITAAVQETGGYPLQTIQGRAIVWTVQDTNSRLRIDFPGGVSKFRARYALKAKYGQHHVFSSEFTDPLPAVIFGDPTEPEVASEPGGPNGAPFFREGVLEFPTPLTAHAVILDRLDLSWIDSSLPADAQAVTLVLDDIEAEAAPACRLGVPEITSSPASLKVVGPGVDVPVSWMTSSGTSANAHYVLETSLDCDFSTLQSSETVNGTTANLSIPDTIRDRILYLRVYAEDACDPLQTLRSPGSARAIQIGTPVRMPIGKGPGHPEPRSVPPRD